MKKNTIYYFFFFLLCSAIAISSCKQKNNDYEKVIHDPLLYSLVMHKLNYVVIYDIFTPPVAARIFAYSNLAAYEVLANDKKHQLISLQGKVKGLNNIPSPGIDSKIDYPFASLIALLKVGDNLTFSADTMRLLTDSVKALAKDNGMPDEIFDGSVAYGNQVADSVISWSKHDNYAQTRGATFAVSNIEGHWAPTPPAYFPAVEPLWPTLRCMVMDSANMFPPPPPPAFSKDTSSEFYKMAVDVMHTGNTLDSTKKWIANFWDCNSFKMHIEGHAMFATKAMTPCGHWMEIVGTIAKNNNADFYKTASAYAGASIGIYDAFICCWYTKYKFDILRPETYINRYIDQAWMPYLQTPPFPEYNSAHSTISAAAATVLGQIFKNNTAFRDSSERDWGWPDRTFKNSDEAAIEVSYSRFYGGIHYKNSVLTAYEQGKKIGNLVMNKLTGVQYAFTKPTQKQIESNHPNGKPITTIH
ncbi:MAG: vanadium-dependent haloperoxidase [Bacteroidota bacterium]|nr:vanadium-dependent haloperoxidase [Bacteroidota bacterium]